MGKNHREVVHKQQIKQGLPVTVHVLQRKIQTCVWKGNFSFFCIRCSSTRAAKATLLRGTVRFFNSDNLPPSFEWGYIYPPQAPPCPRLPSTCLRSCLNYCGNEPLLVIFSWPSPFVYLSWLLKQSIK